MAMNRAVPLSGFCCNFDLMSLVYWIFQEGIQVVPKLYAVTAKQALHIASSFDGKVFQCYFRRILA